MLTARCVIASDHDDFLGPCMDFLVTSYTHAKLHDCERIALASLAITISNCRKIYILQPILMRIQWPVLTI